MPWARDEVLFRAQFALIARLGAFSGNALGFVPWDCSLDDALDRVRSVYVNDYDDSNAWDWYCVLELTRKG